MSSDELSCPNYKALFIVSSTAQAEILATLSRELHDYDISATNISTYFNRSQVERSLTRLNLSHNIIENRSQRGVKQHLEQIRPHIVVVFHDDTPMDRLFVKSANSMRIPTLLIQDGIMGHNQDLLMKGAHGTGKMSYILKYFSIFFASAPKFILRNDVSWKQKVDILRFELVYGAKWRGVYPGFGECLKMAAFGEATKNFWISNGADPKRVVITGNPKFDQVYHSRDDNCRDSVCKKWKIPTHKEIIVLLTQYFVEAKMWSSEQRRSFIIAIANASAKLPNTQLIIKLHPPHENEEDYNEIVKDLPTDPIICKYASLPELLNACNLAITVSSTAALEAMALGKPVVIVNLFDNKGASFYKESGGLYVETEQDILPTIQKALYDPNIGDYMKKSMEKFVYSQAYLQDGLSSNRIADLIRDMISGGLP